MEKLDVIIIMPVYNEQDIILKVLSDWYNLLNMLKLNYKFIIYNDGSSDNTESITSMYISDKNKFILINKKNTGHGSTLVQAYKENCHCEWIFQTDSDDEISSSYFIKFWEQRQNHDLVIGKRNPSNKSKFRKIISYLAKTIVCIFYSRGISDVNVPFRLMRVSKFRIDFLNLPDKLSIPNIILSGIANKKNYKVLEIPVEYNKRIGGHSLSKKIKLFRTLFLSAIQLLKLKIFNK